MPFAGFVAIVRYTSGFRNVAAFQLLIAAPLASVSTIACVPFVFHCPIPVYVDQFADGGGPSAVRLKVSSIPVVGKYSAAEGETEAEGEREALGD